MKLLLLFRHGRYRRSSVGDVVFFCETVSKKLFRKSCSGVGCKHWNSEFKFTPPFGGTIERHFLTVLWVI
jgi:hypothetical protein